jgi:hypothetical protein
MPNPQTAERIRSIFLHDGQPVTPEEAARLLGWSLDDMDALIKWREVDVAGTSSGPRIARAELVSHALRQWPLSLIHGAIGAHAVTLIPPAVQYAGVAL